eukprot:605881-Pleurochrysis_carterae.AAC.4
MSAQSTLEESVLSTKRCDKRGRRTSLRSVGDSGGGHGTATSAWTAANVRERIHQLLREMIDAAI